MRGYLPHYISRLMNVLNLRLLEHLRPLQVTVQQFRIMQMLDAREVASVGEISRDTVIEQSVVSRIVDQLERRGFVTRSKRKGNARIVDVKLTEEGRSTFAMMRPYAQAIVADAVSALSATERRAMEDMLQRMFDHVTAPRHPWLDTNSRNGGSRG
ncbi:MAG: MarR family transcriptional regulator [Alphaproteobacteria bacterium]|nr:MarR family transcriptional regulator [Alphaproteobacteria bacterium]